MTVSSYLKKEGFNLYKTYTGFTDFMISKNKEKDKFIEVKSNNDNLSENQKTCIEMLIELNYEVLLAEVSKYNIFNIFKIEKEFNMKYLYTVEFKSNNNLNIEQFNYCPICGRLDMNKLSNRKISCKNKRCSNHL